jgi:hypothetical protein
VPPAAHQAVTIALEHAEAPAGAATAVLRFTVAEGDGSYLCPACGRQDWVPLTIDLD